MADISETLLQAAQVINQSYSMLAQAQQQKAELEVRRKNYEDMAQVQQQKLTLQAQVNEMTAEKNRLSDENRKQALDLEAQRVETGQGQLAVNQAQLGLNEYKAQQDKVYKENKFSKGEYDALLNRLDNSLMGLKTGQPDLDKSPLIELRTKQLQDQIPVLLKAQTTGDLASLGPEFKIAIAASNPGLLDKDKAAALTSQITRLLDFRKGQADRIVEGYPERERNIIRGTDFMKDSLQTTDTSVQKQLGDQANASAGVRQQAVRPAVGTTQQSPLAPPSPMTAAANDAIDHTPAAILTSVDGQNQTAEIWGRALHDLDQAGLRTEAAALIQKMVSRSPATARKVAELRAASRSK